VALNATTAIGVVKALSQSWLLVLLLLLLLLLHLLQHFVQPCGASRSMDAGSDKTLYWILFIYLYVLLLLGFMLVSFWILQCHFWCR